MILIRILKFLILQCGFQFFVTINSQDHYFVELIHMHFPRLKNKKN